MSTTRGVLGGALAGLAAATGSTGFLMTRGRLHLDVGWGRSTHALGPLSLHVAAARSLVFEQISAPYLGRIPAALQGKLSVLERGDNLVVAEHHTHLPIMDAITVETVTFEPPERIRFRLLRGPVPSVTEEFVFDEEESGTLFTYRGELSADLWAIGRLYGAKLVKPFWESTVRASMEHAKAGAEQRAAAHRRRGLRGSAESPPDG